MSSIVTGIVFKCIPHPDGTVSMITVPEDDEDFLDTRRASRITFANNHGVAIYHWDDASKPYYIRHLLQKPRYNSTTQQESE